MGEPLTEVDGICGVIGGADDDKRMCAFEPNHDGPHGWEVDPDLSVLANEIAIETRCSDEVALVTARYAHQQIEGWKTAAEKAWATAEVARSLAAELHEKATAVVEAYDAYSPAVDPAVEQSIEALRALVTE